MTFHGLLNTTMTTQREGSVSANGFGGRSGTWADYLVGVGCRVQQIAGDEISSVDEGSQSLVVRKKLWFDLGTDLGKADRVVLFGVTHEVVSLDLDVAGAGHHGEAELVEVRA